MSHADAVSALDLDLNVDKALSYGQLYHYYNLTLADIAVCEHNYKEVFIALSHHSRMFKRVGFITLKPYKRLSANALRHLAGVAELRRQLAASRDSWCVERRFSAETPDALWQSCKGPVAIEFDTGSYSKTVLQKKLSAFSSLRQIWGSPSPKRVAYLNQLMHLQELDGQALHVNWAKLL